MPVIGGPTKPTVLRLFEEHKGDILGVACIALGLVSGLAIYAQSAGPLGEDLRQGVGALIGLGKVVVPIVLILLGLSLLRGRTDETEAPVDPSEHAVRLGIGGALVALAATGLLHLTRGKPEWGDATELFEGAGGYVGFGTGGLLDGLLGSIASACVLVALGTVGVVMVTQVSLHMWFQRTVDRVSPVGSLFGRAWYAIVGEPDPNLDTATVATSAGAVEATATASAASAPAPIMVGGQTVGFFRSEVAAAGRLAPKEHRRSKANVKSVTRGEALDPAEVIDPLLGKEGAAPTEELAEVVPLRKPVEPAPEPKPAKPKVIAPAAKQPKTAPTAPGEQLEMDLGPRVKGSSWKLPKLTLLDESDAQNVDRKLVEEAGETLERALAAHGVETRLVGMVVGPTVTRYELELGEGVKVARVTSLNRDIAYAMASPDVRILAPIPGRQAIGVEVPNEKRQIVALGDLLRSAEARRSKNPLEVAIGRDINGKSHLMDLAKMPHLLIAGATGSGKSSCINSIITSVLMRTTPDQVRMILVDPKMVEMTQYERVPHLLTPPVTDPKKAANALAWACREMDRRYELLSGVGYRDIGGYNKAFDKGELPEVDAEDPNAKQFPRLPLILVVVDELADLMMVAARDVEDSICRIAQKARAVGIHLVIATQRPSTNVITGVIKANIPARLAFSVSSLTDSRVILDQPGAERLVGRGDMLLLDQTSSVPSRIQGCWVTEDEVKKVVAAWRKQEVEVEEEAPSETEGAEIASDSVAVDSIVDGPAPGAAGGAAEPGSDDDLFQQARELVITSQLGSTSMLQRKLRVGFARAGRLMDLLEEAGVVGPSVGSKAREVLIDPES